jgi:hypothetical protein
MTDGSHRAINGNNTHFGDCRHARNARDETVLRGPAFTGRSCSKLLLSCDKTRQRAER